MSHLGRPDGLPKKEFSLRPVAEVLSKLLNKYVSLASSDTLQSKLLNVLTGTSSSWRTALVLR